MSEAGIDRIEVLAMQAGRFSVAVWAGLAMTMEREYVNLASAVDYLARTFGAASGAVWTIGALHTFNTGRQYAKDGQPIVWAVLKCSEPYGQCVVFIDQARGIDGVIDLHFGNLDLIDDRWVLRAYDDHHYRHGFELVNMLRKAGGGL